MSYTCRILTPHAHLALSRARNISTLGGSLPARNANPTPSPISARPAATKDIDIGSRASNCSGNSIQLQLVNLNTISRRASWRSILIILLDNDAVFLDTAEFDVRVCDACNAASCTGDGLDANTVVGVYDLRVGDCDGVNDVVGAATDGAD